MAIFVSPKTHFRSDGEQVEDRAILKYEIKSLQKGITTLLEASHDHFLVTPPSHFTPQKVRGLVVGFTLPRGITVIKKYSYPLGSQEKIPSQIDGPKMTESVPNQ